MTVTLHHGDCLQILPTIEAGSIDAIITDLPYGTTACKWDEIIPFAPMWEQVKRILKPRGVFVTTASQPFTSKLIMSNLNWFKYEWIWHKNTGVGFAYSKHQPMKYHENILVFSINGNLYNPQETKRTSIQSINRNKYQMKDKSEIISVAHAPMKGLTRKYNSETKLPESVLKINTESNSLGKLHPTQKPVALYEYLIKTYTNAGDTVLDFTMGSGTTGVGCVNTGRNFIGVEKELNYFEIAERRIKQAQAARQLELV